MNTSRVPCLGDIESGVYQTTDMKIYPEVCVHSDELIRTTRCPLWLVYRKCLVDFLCIGRGIPLHKYLQRRGQCGEANA